jgi:hypothetical protein
MNERIQELADQAAEDMLGALNIPDEFCKKFAELLLKDCVSNVEVWEKDSRNHISYMLKNHYDIEV